VSEVRAACSRSLEFLERITTMSIVEKKASEVRKWHKIVKKTSDGEVLVMPIIKVYSYGGTFTKRGSYTKRMIAIVYQALSGNEQTLRYSPIVSVLVEDGMTTPCIKEVYP
jgi:hypothetical protein